MAQPWLDGLHLLHYSAFHPFSNLLLPYPEGTLSSSTIELILPQSRPTLESMFPIY
jgi:hypothetical protein